MTGALEKVWKGKGKPSDFPRSKSADAAVNECRRKAGERREIMITVLTWFSDRFLWSPSSVTEAIPSFDSFPPKSFPIAALTLAFYRPRILQLSVEFNTLHRADVE